MRNLGALVILAPPPHERVGSDVVRGDLMRLGIEEEEGEVMLAGHPDVGFIAGGRRA